MLYFYCFWLSMKVKTMKLIGRVREIQKIDRLMSSTQSEFLAIYGRRRVGKTFLIRDYFKNEFDFYATGLAKGNTKQQLTNFTIFINNYFSGSHVVPANWLEAFNLLIKELEQKKTTSKKIIFIDEMPWMDTKKSDFMMGLSFFGMLGQVAELTFYLSFAVQRIIEYLII